MNPIIILCRNSLGLTKNAIASILSQDIEVELYAIDNASSDGTSEYLRDLPGTNIHAYRFDPQVSVAKAWNVGLTRIFQHSEYCLVVNNDVVLRTDTYRCLLAADEYPFVTGVGVNTMAQRDETFVKSVRPRPDFSCYLIRKEAWEKVGPFDENYQLAFCEDCGWHVEAHRKGVMCVTIGIPFFHISSGTIKNADPTEANRIHQQANRNRQYFFEKYGAHIGTPEYDALFSDATFGMDKVTSVNVNSTGTWIGGDGNPYGPNDKVSVSGGTGSGMKIEVKDAKKEA